MYFSLLYLVVVTIIGSTIGEVDGPTLYEIDFGFSSLAMDHDSPISGNQAAVAEPRPCRRSISMMHVDAGGLG